MKILKEKGQKDEIQTVEKWFELCPPAKGKAQWQCGHSAKEMAKFWVKTENQIAVEKFVNSKIPDCNFDYAIPEFPAKFDDSRSPRKDDLRIFSSDGNTEISIEGKVTETFGSATFCKELELSKIIKQKTPKSKKLDRINGLYLNFFKSNEKILSIRYQLAYWFAGAIAKTKAENIVLILQEFRKENSSKKNSKNHTEFNKFIAFISENQYNQISKNEIVGKINNQFTNGKNLYIGYKVCEIL
jgi:hypothetical protein